MPSLAANLSMMYGEYPFLDRFAQATADGFAGVEFLFPYEYPAQEIRARLDAAHLTLALFNAPPGDWAAGERGIAALPGREDEFWRSIDIALSYAAELGNQRVHIMAGLLAPGAEHARYRATYVANLALAARAAAAAGITIVIEPINIRDMPGYFLNYQEEAHAICREIGAPNLKVQFDLYHAQIMEGDLATKLKRYIADVGHIQIASVPERHEPDAGEVDYRYLLALIDSLGYDGWIGCEYRPRAHTRDGLQWLGDWGLARRS